MKKEDIESQFFKTVGQNIRRIRKSKKPKLTMEKLGSEIGQSRQSVHRIEMGSNITLRTIHRLSAALQINPSDLIKLDQ